MIIITDSYAARDEIRLLDPSFSRRPSQNFEMYKSESAILVCILSKKPLHWAAITASVYTLHQREKILFLMTHSQEPPLIRIHRVYGQNQEVFPDILEMSNIPESSREDVKLLGGYEAASLFLGPHAIFCFSTCPPLDEEGKEYCAQLIKTSSFSLQSMIRKHLTTLPMTVSQRFMMEKKLYRYCKTHPSFQLSPQFFMDPDILTKIESLKIE